MQRYFINLLICIISIGMGSSLLVNAANKNAKTAEIRKLYKKARQYKKTDEYKIPTPDELREFSIIIHQCLELHEKHLFDKLKSLSERASGLGFQIHRAVDSNGRKYTVVMELDDRRFGGGMYVFSDSFSKTRPLLLQTPHARSDELTGNIGFNLLCNTNISAIYTSTMRRDTRVKKDEEGNEIQLSDPAHQIGGFFHVATKIYTYHHPDLLLVQLHGFQRNSDRKFDVVISPGFENRNNLSLYQKLDNTIRTCLSDRQVVSFGEETVELGALTNVQGQFIHAHSSGIFIHLELEHSIRKNLMESASFQQNFERCFNQIIEQYESY